jgi:hypothetical protein
MYPTVLLADASNLLKSDGPLGGRHAGRVNGTAPADEDGFLESYDEILQSGISNMPLTPLMAPPSGDVNSIGSFSSNQVTAMGVASAYLMPGVQPSPASFQSASPYPPGMQEPARTRFCRVIRMVFSVARIAIVLLLLIGHGLYHDGLDWHTPSCPGAGFSSSRPGSVAHQQTPEAVLFGIEGGMASPASSLYTHRLGSNGSARMLIHTPRYPSKAYDYFALMCE